MVEKQNDYLFDLTNSLPRDRVNRWRYSIGGVPPIPLFSRTAGTIAEEKGLLSFSFHDLTQEQGNGKSIEQIALELGLPEPTLRNCSIMADEARKLFLGEADEVSGFKQPEGAKRMYRLMLIHDAWKRVTKPEHSSSLTTAGSYKHIIDLLQGINICQGISHYSLEKGLKPYSGRFSIIDFIKFYYGLEGEVLSDRQLAALTQRKTSGMSYLAEAGLSFLNIVLPIGFPSLTETNLSLRSRQTIVKLLDKFRDLARARIFLAENKANLLPLEADIIKMFLAGFSPQQIMVETGKEAYWPQFDTNGTLIFTPGSTLPFIKNVVSRRFSQAFSKVRRALFAAKLLQEKPGMDDREKLVLDGIRRGQSYETINKETGIAISTQKYFLDRLGFPKAFQIGNKIEKMAERQELKFALEATKRRWSSYDQDRKILELLCENLSYEEVIDRLNLSLDQVRGAVARARSILIEEMAGQTNDIS